MNAKKVLTLLFGLICVSGLAFYTYTIMSTESNSSTELIDFAIKDTSKVTKIIITDPFQKSFQIDKVEGVWRDKNGGCITQAYAHNILNVAKNIEFKGYLSKNSH